MVNFFKPTTNDISSMEDIVKDDVDSGLILVRSEDEMATNIRSYTAVKVDSKLVGFVALHIHTPNLGEIRSLVVDKNYRGQRYASKLIQKVIEEAKNLQLSEILVLTYKKNLFEFFNFKEINKLSIPESKIWTDCIKCKHFPICDEISLSLKL